MGDAAKPHVADQGLKKSLPAPHDPLHHGKSETDIEDPDLQEPYVDDSPEDDDSNDDYEDLDEDEEEEEEDEDEEEEEEEEEHAHNSDDDLSDVEPPAAQFQWHPSEEDFKESDLQNRKKRRYIMAGHSFLELNDPKLESALNPATSGDEYLTDAEKTRKGLSLERANYKDACKAAGIAPNATFLRSLGTNTLDLTNHGLSPPEIEAICHALYEDKHIEFCFLGGNDAGKVGGLAIAGMIENNFVIEVLNLANTDIVEAIEEICEAVTLTTCLISLDLSKNELIDQDMFLIGNMLAENESLKRLYLAHNEIKDAGLAEIGFGLIENKTLILLDLSGNRIKGEARANKFFAACADHPQLRHLDMRRNIIRNDGAKGIARVLSRNTRMQYLDLSINIMEEPSGSAIGRSLNVGPREMEILQLDQQWWHQQAAAAILRPLGSAKNKMPIELVDFGFIMDIHKSFITARDKALALHPNLKIISGEPYGMHKAKGPDPKALVIRRANIVCENFNTPLVMLMEELAKEPKVIKVADFKKFIKQCNLYKDKTLTEAFENVFAAGTPIGTYGTPTEVNGEAILEAFDKEYPGLRVIPEPKPDEEPAEPPKKKEKKKKGKGGKKGKGKKAAGGGAATKSKPKGKGKKKK